MAVSSMVTAGQTRAIPDQRAKAAAEKFQANVFAELLKPLAPLLAGPSAIGEPSAGSDTSQDFYGFLMLEHLAKSIASGDRLGIADYIARRSAGSPDMTQTEETR